MIDTCKLHDDLEDFASYLGVDYEDYYQLIYNLHDEDEFELVNVGLTDWLIDGNVFALKLHILFIHHFLYYVSWSHDWCSA